MVHVGRRRGKVGKAGRVVHVEVRDEDVGDVGRGMAERFELGEDRGLTVTGRLGRRHESRAEVALRVDARRRPDPGVDEREPARRCGKRDDMVDEHPGIVRGSPPSDGRIRPPSK